MNTSSFSYTHPGHIRKINEDSFYSSDEDGLWIVCDGMGGHKEGNFASHLVTDTFEYLRLHDSFEDNINLFKEQIEKIQNKLILKVKMSSTNDLIGTTLLLLYIQDNKACLIHCGDSRCYNLRNNTLSLVSKDHTRELMTDEGIKKVLTKALYAPGEFFIETKKFLVNVNDVFLLCSDGLYDNLTNESIKAAMNMDVLESAMKNLSSIVLNTKADDNLTAVLVSVT